MAVISADGYYMEWGVGGWRERERRERERGRGERREREFRLETFYCILAICLIYIPQNTLTLIMHTDGTNKTYKQQSKLTKRNRQQQTNKTSGQNSHTPR